MVSPGWVTSFLKRTSPPPSPTRCTVSWVTGSCSRISSPAKSVSSPLISQPFQADRAVTHPPAGHAIAATAIPLFQKLFLSLHLLQYAAFETTREIRNVHGDDRRREHSRLRRADRPVLRQPRH